MARTLLCLSCNVRFEPATADAHDMSCPLCGGPLIAAPPWTKAPLAVDVPPPPASARLRGPVSCRHCGKTVPVECVFCPFCEKPLALSREQPLQPWPRRRSLRIALAGLGAVGLAFWGAIALVAAVQHGDLVPAAILGVVLSVLFIVGLVGYSTKERWRELGAGEVVLRLLIGVGTVAAVGCGCSAALMIFLLVVCMGRRW